MTRQEKWNDSAIQKVINDGVKAAKGEIRSQVHGAKVRNGKIMAQHIREHGPALYRRIDSFRLIESPSIPSIAFDIGGAG